MYHELVKAERICRPGAVFPVPEGDGALFAPFRGHLALVEEIEETVRGAVVTVRVGGVQISCPLAYLEQSLREAPATGTPLAGG